MSLTRIFGNFGGKSRSPQRRLKLEQLERREVFSSFGFSATVDLDDEIVEAVSLGAASAGLDSTGTIDNGDDVDMYSFTAEAGETVDIRVESTTGNLSSRVRLFGELLGRENQLLGTGIGTLRFKATTAGTYYLGVSELGNESYNPITGNSDFNDPTPTTGDYRLTVNSDQSGMPEEPSSNEHTDLAEIAVRFTDVDGESIDGVEVGQEFHINVSIQDLRLAGEDKGAFGALFDVRYDTSLIDVVEITHLAPFTQFTSGEINDTAGLIDDVGGLDGVQQPETRAPQNVVTLKAVATAAGQLAVRTDPGESAVVFNLLFGVDDDVTVNTSFGGASLEIGQPENTTQCHVRQNCSVAEDVNGDGVVSPIDALQIINDLNGKGSRPLASSGTPFIDVSGDGSVSPIDALLVINYLNGRSNSNSGNTLVNPPTSASPSDSIAADPVGRIPRNPSAPGSATGGCALSRVGVLTGATCESSNASRIPRPTSSDATALSRVGQLLGHSTTSSAYASSIDQALDELLAAN